MLRLYCHLQDLARNEEGATAVEYGLLVALIAVLVAGVALTLGQEVRDAFQAIINVMP